nr:uncharacterized protein LOC113807610 [Penaeus vannamei]
MDYLFSHPGCLQKLKAEVKGWFIVPLWTSQSWMGMLRQSTNHYEVEELADTSVNNGGTPDNVSHQINGMSIVWDMIVLAQPGEPMLGIVVLQVVKPRYSGTWDVSPVLQKLRELEPLHSIPLKNLTLKLVMLMALTQAARVQTLHLLVIKNMKIKQDNICVWLGGNIKQCRPNYNVQFLNLKAYVTDKWLFVYNPLKMYINKTEELRCQSGECEDISCQFIKPHKCVSKDTVARWIRMLLMGIDTNKYSAGSVSLVLGMVIKKLQVIGIFSKMRY